ncbi:ABC transporter permease [Tepidimonas charontis]|uniref:FtsX-like permease family protein n=1 Tax=Tepidimonas charontis TaxID=2267262 RepID=A0A554XGC2_9BURK|nr:FtsX-like permease family protein [Tepidimonas charontis]TSE34887.1 FtsX-like permease family protein [Tepidimonas charontis]
MSSDVSPSPLSSAPRSTAGAVPSHGSIHTPSAWSLGVRALWRDWRAGELTVLMLAIVLAVAALAAVAFFADRLQAGLQRDARQLLGADVVLRSDHPLPPEYAQQARALGLAVVHHVTFPTMARADDADGGEVRLVSLKAVSAGYPLRGELRTSGDVADRVGQLGAGQPAPGQVWADAALLEALNLQLGQRLWLGERAFELTRVITLEPDRGAGFLTFAPRVLMALDDLPATGLVQPASRIQYRLAVAGDDAAVRRFETWAQARLQATAERGTHIESVESGRPELQQTLQRAEQFLRLVALLTALLAAVAVAVAARQYALRHLDGCALLRVLGLSQGRMAGAYVVSFGLAGVVAALVGVALGFAVHFVFVWWLADLLQASLPAAGWAPVALGLGVGLTLMAAFGLPPVLQLAQTPPLRVIRRDVGGVRAASALVWLGGAGGFVALLVAASRDLTLGGIAVGGFGAAVAVFAAVTWLALRLLRALVAESSAPRWLVLATRQLTARPGYAVVQVCSLAVGLLALLLLVLLRTDLIDSWRRATPPDAPNRFVINIQPDQASSFQAFLAEHGVQRFDWYPMVRGRLVALNGRPVRPEQFAGERAQRLVEREFNLSYSAELPAHNPVVAGRWQSGEAEAVSIEQGLAQTLGLRVGDTLTFDIAGVLHTARITSLRKVDWASMRVNFFALYPVARLADDVPYTHIAAFRAPAQAGFDRALLRRFPNVTNVDTSAALAQVQRVLEQVIRAVEFLFAFSVAAGVVVLLATVSATRTQREREYAVLRALGASAALLRRMQRAELAGVGALAGLLAAAAAAAVGWALARRVFEFDWQVSPWVPLAGAVAGALLALLAGWWSLRGVLRAPVVQTLRHAAE